MKKILFILFGIILSCNSWALTLINDTEIEKQVTDIIAPITKAAKIPENSLKIYLVRSDEFNAFVRGGEDIFIYTGLLKQIKTPNALRAVVAHELGHTIGGHIVQMSDRMSAEMTRAIIIQALGIGLMVAGGNPSAGAGVIAGATGIAQQSLLSFSRDEERMADDLGIELMIKAKQDPNGFLEVFEQIQNINEAIEQRINPNNVNHPLTSERLNNTKEKIKNSKNIVKQDPNIAKKEQEQFELIRAKLVGYLDTQETVIAKYPNKDKSHAAIYARAIAYMQRGNLKSALIGTGTLIGRNPSSPYFYELLGDIEYQYGHYDDSVSAYENSLKYSNNAPQIESALALVLSERRKADDLQRASELCKHVILVDPTPLAYWILAKVSPEGISEWALAEFYLMNGDKNAARQHAKKAQKKLKTGSPEYIKAGDILK
ncbi:MAG: M48 family metalloprotease [Alphaproteobacteria bacterium]|nr:M48 family metalloprotease [Alphaproteobacteria bacterium]